MQDVYSRLWKLHLLKSLGVKARCCVCVAERACVVMSLYDVGHRLVWPIQVHGPIGGGLVSLGTAYWNSRPVREAASGSQLLM